MLENTRPEQSGRGIQTICQYKSASSSIETVRKIGYISFQVMEYNQMLTKKATIDY